MGSPGIRFTQETISSICRLYRDGVHVCEIARRIGSKPTSVTRILKSNGILLRRPIGPKYFNHLARRKMSALYLAGQSLSQIARKYQCSIYPIRSALHAEGVQIRKACPLRKVLKPKEMEKFRVLYESRHSLVDIAKRLGISGNVASRIRNQLNLPVRVPVREGHALWKGGRVTCGGYVLVRIYSDDPLYAMANSRGYAAEHRVVLARSLGRPLDRSESVHHINGDKGDNRIENLQLRQSFHGKMQRYCCSDYGSFNIKAIPL